MQLARTDRVSLLKGKSISEAVFHCPSNYQGVEDYDNDSNKRGCMV
jgi:hypothetical protein